MGSRRSRLHLQADVAKRLSCSLRSATIDLMPPHEFLQEFDLKRASFGVLFPGRFEMNVTLNRRKL